MRAKDAVPRMQRTDATRSDAVPIAWEGGGRGTTGLARPRRWRVRDYARVQAERRQRSRNALVALVSDGPRPPRRVSGMIVQGERAAGVGRMPGCVYLF